MTGCAGACGAASPAAARWLDDDPRLLIAHASAGDTGVTVLAAPGDGAVGAVDVRGGGPGTRETDLLEPHNTVERVHAVVLAGGSAFGLAAADGVMRELADRGEGFRVFPDRELRVPIVPAAVIFDLVCGEPDLPDAELGRAAARAALDGGAAWAPGTAGAGTGALAGALKGGVGRAGVVREGDGEGADGSKVAAVVVANPVGAVADPATGRLWADPEAGRLRPEALAELGERFVGLTKLPVPREAGDDSPPALNTTIGAVVVDAPVTPAQAKRIAMAAHDGLARAIRPAHLPMDGDTIFCLGLSGDSSGVPPERLALLCADAADCAAAAVADAVVSATARGGAAAWSDLVEDASDNEEENP
ncbi:P1 family peptidase [Corynebacterium sp. 335C]